MSAFVIVLSVYWLTPVELEYPRDVKDEVDHEEHSPE